MPADHPEFGVDHAPRVRGLTYPGRWPDESALITSDDMWFVRDRFGHPLAATDGDSAPHRLQACRVDMPVPDRERLGLYAGIDPTLSVALDALDVTPMDRRVPVISVGSNAAPSQLRHKYGHTSASDVVPSMRATVPGLAVVYAAMLAPYGAVPMTAVEQDGAAAELFIQFLDDAQLRRMDATEGGYRRLWWGHRLTLATGEILAGAYLYVAEAGHLAQGAEPLRATLPFDTPPWPTTAFRAQRDVITFLLATVPALASGLGERPEAWARTLSADERALFRDAVEEAGLVRPPTIGASTRDPASAEYRRLVPDPAPAGNAVAVSVVPTDVHVRHRGESVVGVSAETFDRLGRPDHVEVRSAQLARTLGAARPAPAAVGRIEVLPAERLGSRAGVAQVDQVLRDSVGCFVGDQMLLRPVHIRRFRWSDLLFGTPNYLTVRVTPGDPAVTERDACLLSQISLDVLGIQSGDRVVIEGCLPCDDGDGGDDPTLEVPTVTVKAFLVPDEAMAARRAATRGSWGARFPHARDALGVQPDRPVVFLDAAERQILGLATIELAAVRIRPARGHRFLRELREMLLVLAVASIGIVSLVHEPWLIASLLGGFALATIGLAVWRLRAEMSHTLRVRRAEPHRR